MQNPIAINSPAFRVLAIITIFLIAFSACDEEDPSPQDPDEGEETEQGFVFVQVMPADGEKVLEGVDVELFDNRDAYNEGEEPRVVRTTFESDDFGGTYAIFDDLEPGNHFFAAEHLDYGSGVRDFNLREEEAEQNVETTIFLRK